MTECDYKSIIRPLLGDRRYHHSICVSKEAVRLAKMYGADEKKAQIAGILHDVTKEFTHEEHLRLMKEGGYVPTKLELNAPKLWHSITGAIYVRLYLGIEDEDIINSIRYHTTGRKDMSILEKVIFLADFTSEERDYKDVDIMREKTYSSIKEGMIYGLRHTIKKLVKKELPVSENSVDAYNQSILED